MSAVIYTILKRAMPTVDISPNTPFDKLPDSWVCPVCGAPKDMFEKV